MNPEYARRRLPDLAVGELDPITAWRVRRCLERSLPLQQEWNEITSLYKGLRGLSTVETALPPPQWADAPTKSPSREVVQGNTDWVEVPRGPRRWALPEIALATWIVLLTLPLTGWLMRGQLGFLLTHHNSLLALPGTDAALLGQLHQARAINDGDMASEVGAILLDVRKIGPPEDQETAAENQLYRFIALTRLKPQFGKAPLLNAALLNEASLPSLPKAIDSGLPWDDADELKLELHRIPIDRRLVAQCIGFAKTGERSDPENAYFPLMRAYCHLALGQVEESMAAVRIAGRKSHFRDYSAEMTTAKWAAMERLTGEPGSIRRVKIGNNSMFYSLARLRSVTRCLTGRAIALELRGKTGEAFALRSSLVHAGALMQVEGPSFIHSLVGAAIGAIAINRPGGSPAIDGKDFKNTTDQDRVRELMVQRRQAVFYEYARKAGHPEVATMARILFDGKRDAYEIFNRATERDFLGTGLREMPTYIIAFGAGYLLLLSLSWVLFLGIGATLLARTGPIRRGERAMPAIGWGSVLLVVPPALSIGLANLENPLGGLVPFALIICGVVLGECARVRARRRPDEGYLGTAHAKQNIRIALTTVSLAYVVLGVMTWMMNGILLQATSFANLQNAELANVNDSGKLACVVYGISLAPSLVTMIVLAIISYRRRIPGTVGVVRGFRWVAVPLAGLLALLYAGLTVYTAQLDARIRQQLTERNQNEIAFLRKIANGGDRK